MATATAIREKIRANFAESRANWHPSTGDPELVKLLGGGWGGPTFSNQHVTPDTALRVSSVFACVRLAQRTIAALPKMVFQRAGERSKKPVPKHPVAHLLRVRPNPSMTPSRFFTVMQGHLELRGNAYAFIEWGKNGYPKALWPWHPDRVEVKHDGLTAEYFFHTKNRGRVPVAREDVLHHVDFTMDGFTGLSTIAYAREAIGLGMSTEEFGARFFGQGFHAQGWVKNKLGMSPQARKNQEDAVRQWHQGSENAHGTLILAEDGEYHTIGINPDDMQFLESRQFTPVDICRFFGFHPDMIGAGKETADNKLQQLDIRFRMHGILPRAVSWEETLGNALIPERDRDEFLIGMNLDGLERADIKSRFEAHKSSIDAGWANRNEVRLLENREPEEGLDEFLEPMNLGPAGVQEPNAPSKQAAKDNGKRGRKSEDRLKAELRTSFELRDAKAERRKSLRESFRPLFADAFSRLVKREVREVRVKLVELRARLGMDEVRGEGSLSDASAKRPYLERRAAADEFSVWLEQYYAEFEGAIRAGVEPAVNALADAVALQALNEIDGDDEADISDAVNAYLDDLAKRHASSSKGQLRSLLEDDAFQDAVEQRLIEWLDKRADKESANETTQAEGYFARTALTQMGVTAFRWTVVGETCPLCKELDGRIVGSSEPFAKPGDWINPNKEGQDREDDEKVSLKVRHNIFHPPLHQGCDCLLIPEF